MSKKKKRNNPASLSAVRPSQHAPKAPAPLLSRRNIILWGAGMLILGLLAYARSFGAEFHLDDFVFIVNNPSIRSIDNLWETGRGVLSFHSRYLAFITFALNYHFHGTDVFGYHVMNFIIHILSAILVWAVGHSLFKTPRLENDPITQTRARLLVPFFAALIFFVHPVNTQAVTYISQRFESMASMFYLAAVWSYLQARLASKTILRAALFSIAILSAIAGMLTKEIVITLPVMAVVLEFVFFRTAAAARRKIPWELILPGAGLFLIVPALLSFQIQGLLAPQISGCHENEIIYFHEYLLTQLRVLATFIRLAFIPINQNFDYDFPKSAGFFDPATTFASLIFLASLLWLSFWTKKKNILISFGIWWFFIVLAVNFIPRRYVIFEHKVYLSGIGIYWATLTALFLNERYLKQKVAAVIIIAVILATLTSDRNNVWLTEEALWSDAIIKSPNKYPSHLNLGQSYQNQGRFEEAIKEYGRALEILPSGYLAYNNRGVIYLKTNNLDQALADFNTTIELRPEQPEAYENRGLLYTYRGEHTKALADLNKGLELLPRNEIAHCNRADLYSRMGEIDKATLDFNRAVELNPRNSESFRRRGQFYQEHQKFPEALTDYNQSIALNPQEPACYVSRGNLLSDNKRFAEAIADYNKALELNPRIGGIYFNLGNAMLRQGDQEAALKYYARSLELDPTLAVAYLNMGNIYYARKDYDNARKNFEKTVALDPRNIMAQNYIARIYSETGNQPKYDEKVADMRKQGIPVITFTPPAATEKPAASEDKK